ncbi:hypothetical protein [Nostoc sp.]|uniref:hypothetical protein n=1 Tax=Nostoc sp. TaxID=1180 RepID=UPI002FF6F22E
MFTTGVAATLPSLSDQAMSTMVTELCPTPMGKQASKSVSKSCAGYDARSRQRAVGKTR